MYVPSHFDEADLSVLHTLIRTYPLGAWITNRHGDLEANHVPFVLDTSCNAKGTLVGHIARANPAWQSFSTDQDSLVIFHGPDAYVSPSWYPSKHEHGKAVPTWNYAAVHVYGVPRVIEDRDWLLRHLAQLTDLHESTQRLPWKLSDAPTEFVDRLVAGIVGVEIPLTRLVGKWKVSQNRPRCDMLGVIEGLRAIGGDHAEKMAELVKTRLPKDR